MAGEGVPVEWVASEIDYGRITIDNGRYRIVVFSDFSGQIIDMDGTGGNLCMEFPDLRCLIEAGKLLETVLVDHYGGYK